MKYGKTSEFVGCRCINRFKERPFENLGFTLAEVLITLGIIGVVAAITIPTLISNYQKTQYVAQLKKVYAQVNQVLIQMASDNGCTGNLACLNFTNQDFGDELVKYIKVSKNCQQTANLGCFSSAVSSNYDGSSSRVSEDNDSWYKFIGVDGVAYKTNSTSASRTANNWAHFGRGTVQPLTQACNYIEVDINGPVKGPNNRGRDIFHFWVSNGKGPALYPTGGYYDGAFGWWSDSNGCRTGTHDDGLSCVGRVVEESWQMNY